MRPIDADELECVSATLPQDASDDYKEGYGDSMKHVLEIVDDLPTITIPQWIPVSERLPDVMGFDERYLVSLAWGGVGVMEYKSTGFHNYGSFNPVPIETVTAWMPLPEPWKGEEDE